MVNGHRSEIESMLILLIYFGTSLYFQEIEEHSFIAVSERKFENEEHSFIAVSERKFENEEHSFIAVSERKF